MAGSARRVRADEVASAVSRGKAAIAAGSAKLGGVVVVVGFEGEDEGICAMRVSGEGIEPTHHPCAESECGVDPVFGVVGFFLARSGLAS